MKTILVVDDSRTTRSYHAAIAASAGYRVVTAVDGADGLEKLLAERCDLVLTDINMTGMDGYEFLRRARELPECEEVPIVIISTASREADKLKAFTLGANLYLVKPSEPQALLDHLQMMLGGTP